MKRRYSVARWGACLCILMAISDRANDEPSGEHNEKAQLTTAPVVPPPITRTSPAVVQAYLNRATNISPNTSLLEMLDEVNERLLEPAWHVS